MLILHIALCSLIRTRVFWKGPQIQSSSKSNMESTTVSHTLDPLNPILAMDPASPFCECKDFFHTLKIQWRLPLEKGEGTSFTPFPSPTLLLSNFRRHRGCRMKRIGTNEDPPPHPLIPAAASCDPVIWLIGTPVSVHSVLMLGHVPYVLTSLGWYLLFIYFIWFSGFNDVLFVCC